MCGVRHKAMTRRNPHLILRQLSAFLAVASLLLVMAVAPAVAAPPALFDEVGDEPAAPAPPAIGEVEFRIAPAPAEDPLPEEFPVVPTPPKLPAEDFGVGWPAAAGVTVALVAVLGMALMWRREPA